MNEQQTSSVPTKTKGQLFKEKHGYSRTMKNLLSKHGRKDENGVNHPLSLEEYKAARKGIKKLQTKVQKDKHAVAKANRKPPKAKAGKKGSSNTKTESNG